MTTERAPGFHVRPGRAVDTSAYEGFTGRWSRLFVPSVLRAAEVQPGDRVLDVSTGTGEAAVAIMPVIGESGRLIGADIAPAMLDSARSRLPDRAFLPVAADGQALPFPNGTFDAVVCQLGLQFFPNPALGLKEFRRVLSRGGRAGICVISRPDRAPMWGVLADVLGRLMPAQRRVVHLSFSLADPPRLERLLIDAGFQDVRVECQTREGVFDSFDEYWQPIEAGIGSIPQTYLMLPDPARRAVQEEVRTRLAAFEDGGRLRMSVEMLIGSGPRPISVLLKPRIRVDITGRPVEQQDKVFMTEVDHSNPSGRAASDFDRSNRSDQADMNRARQAAEALFAAKRRLAEPAAPAPVPATDQTTRKPRILSAVPAKPVSLEAVSSRCKVAPPSNPEKIPAAHFARIRTWLKYGMNISQVAQLYEVPIREIESILKKS